MKQHLEDKLSGGPQTPVSEMNNSFYSFYSFLKRFVPQNLLALGAAGALGLLALSCGGRSASANALEVTYTTKPAVSGVACVGRVSQLNPQGNLPSRAFEMVPFAQDAPNAVVIQSRIRS